MDKPAAAQESTERDALMKLANEVRGWLDLEPVRLAGILGNTNVAVMRETLALADSITATPAASPVAGVSADRKSIAKLIAAEMWPDSPDEYEVAVEVWADPRRDGDGTFADAAFKVIGKLLAQPSAEGDGEPPKPKYELCDTVFPDGQKCVRPKNHNFSKCSPTPKFMEYCDLSQCDEATLRTKENKAKRKASLPAPVAKEGRES